MGLLETVRQGAWKTKLRGELALLDREIARKEALFGVEFFDIIISYKTTSNKNLPSLCDFVSGDFAKTSRAIKLLEDEKEIKAMKIRINRTVTGDAPPESSISDTANEAMVRLQMHGLDRDILKQKEEFGASLSREVAEKARFWSSEGLTARKPNDMVAIRKLMERHSRDLLSLYHERDSKMREIHDAEGPVEVSPQPKKEMISKPVVKRPVSTQVGYESVTRLESYLDRNQAASTRDKKKIIISEKEKAPKKVPMKSSAKEKKAHRSALAKTSSRTQSVPVKQASSRVTKPTSKTLTTNQKVAIIPTKSRETLSNKPVRQSSTMVMAKAASPPTSTTVSSKQIRTKKRVERVRVEI